MPNHQIGIWWKGWTTVIIMLQQLLFHMMSKMECMSAITVSLLSKCNAYSANRGISIECDILRSIFQSGAVVETLKKKQRNAAKFLGSILHHAKSFSML